MVEIAKRDLEAVAYWIGQTLDMAAKYDRHPSSGKRKGDIHASKWWMLELLRRDFHREDIIQISDKVGWLGNDGKRFLDHVINAAEGELHSQELSQGNYRQPVQLNFPFGYNTIAEIICSNYPIE